MIAAFTKTARFEITPSQIECFVEREDRLALLVAGEQNKYRRVRTLTPLAHLRDLLEPGGDYFAFSYDILSDDPDDRDEPPLRFEGLLNMTCVTFLQIKPHPGNHDDPCSRTG